MNHQLILKIKREHEYVISLKVFFYNRVGACFPTTYAVQDKKDFGKAKVIYPTSRFLV